MMQEAAEEKHERLRAAYYSIPPQGVRPCELGRLAGTRDVNNLLLNLEAHGLLLSEEGGRLYRFGGGDE